MDALPVINGSVYIFDVSVIKKLREQYNVAGMLSGILPQYPQQIIFGGLPLQLSPEETQYLLSTGDFVLRDMQSPADRARAGGPFLETDKGCARTTRSSQEGDGCAAADVVIAAAAPSVQLPDEDKYAVFEFLMKRSYFIMPGLRFGCHYMAYPGDIMRYHSHYNVLGFGWTAKFDLLTLVNGGRLATSVKKCWLIGARNPDTTETEVFSIEWAGFG